MSAIPLLSYQLNPSPEPLMASPADAAAAGYNQSLLTLTASNATTQAVTLNYLRLDLPLGSGATDLLDLLTLDELQAAVSVTPDPAWTLYQTTGWSDDEGQSWASYLFHPVSSGTLPINNSWTFTWQGVAPTYWGVPINTVPGGPVGCQVVEGSPGDPVQPLPLSKAPAGWFAPTLVASPVSVASGQAVQLSWNGPAGASYELNNLASGAPDPLPNAGAYASATLLEDTVFTLQVAYSPQQGPAQKAAPQQTVTVTQPAPVITSFTATPDTLYCCVANGVVQPATSLSTILAWQTTNAQNCFLDVSGVAPSGSAPCELLAPTSEQLVSQQTFTLTATADNQPPATATVTTTLTCYCAITFSLTSLGNGLYPFSGNWVVLVPGNSLLTIDLSVSFGGNVVSVIGETCNNQTSYNQEFSEYWNTFLTISESEKEAGAELVCALSGGVNFTATFPLTIPD